MLDLLRDFMAEGDRGILMSTHITSDLEKIADEVVCVDAGSIVFSAPKDAITDEAGVARCRAADVTAILDAGFFAPGEALRLRRARPRPLRLRPRLPRHPRGQGHH